jgi:hypothetical protein
MMVQSLIVFFRTEGDNSGVFLFVLVVSNNHDKTAQWDYYKSKSTRSILSRQVFVFFNDLLLKY